MCRTPHVQNMGRPSKDEVATHSGLSPRALVLPNPQTDIPHERGADSRMPTHIRFVLYKSEQQMFAKRHANGVRTSAHNHELTNQATNKLPA